ncbi:MAG: phosphatidylserine/phosphatidylglycerophosphate/cardiolipin synthase family protein [Bacteroidales bacterium]
MAIEQDTYKIFEDPLRFFNAMLNDINMAKRYIYLETYRFNNDSIGIKFKDALTRKSEQGVEVKVLMDSWGTSLPSSFFQNLTESGGEIRYFQKIKFFWDFFTKNHRRNHRKLLIIDDEITYIGSANLTDYSLNWRELVLRVHSDIGVAFKKAFLQQFEIYNKYVFEKRLNIRKITHGQNEILRDVPSLTKQRIRKRYVELIKRANDEIVIETPYFLPSFLVRKALTDAVKRGVKVLVLMPKHSDVGMINVLRNRYLGPLLKNGIDLMFFVPHNLHAKLLLVDREVYSIGSPNFDYRSFRFQHEIVLLGQDKSVIDQLLKHIEGTIQNSEEFSYEIWLKRSNIQKFFEWLILPFRHLL